MPRRPHLLRRLALLVVVTVVTAGLALVTSSAPAGAVDAPSGLQSGPGVNPTLSWTRVPGATAYDLELSRSAEFTSSARIGNVVSTVNIRYVPPQALPTDQVFWRVRAKVGATVGEFATSSFTAGVQDAPTPLSPRPGDVPFQAPVMPRFTWAPVAGATSYTVQVSSDREFVDTRVTGYAELNLKSTSAFLTSYPPARGDGYYWRVRAELGSGYPTRWSDPIRYDVAPLDAVARTAPAQGAELTDVVLDWEPVPGAATYQLQVSTDNGFLESSLKANVLGITGTRWSPPTTLNNTTYYWRVRAVDTSGNAAPWPSGDPWMFRRSWPSMPAPDPESGEQRPGLTLLHPIGASSATTPFYYEWEPVERASRYTVMLYQPGEADPFCTATTVHTTLAGACVPPTSGEFVWKVQAIDDPAVVLTDIVDERVSKPFSYTKPAAITPAAPGTLSTADVAGHTMAMSGAATYGPPGPGSQCTDDLPDKCENLRHLPVLSWQAPAGARSYRLTLSYDDRLTNVVPGFDGVVVTQPMYTFTRTLPDSQAGSAYLWVVQPCAGSAGTECAPIDYPRHGFAKKSIAPVLVSPIEGVRRSDDVTLEWTTALSASRRPEVVAVDGRSSLTTPSDMDARSYQLQTSTDSTFASGLIDNATVDQTTFTSYAATYPEGPVYWRVRALDGTGNATPWSTTGQFEKRSDPVVPSSPLGTDLAADGTFTWERLPFAATYEIEVYAGATRVAATTKYTSWAPADPLPWSSDYSWRIRRIDAKGRPGRWSHEERPYQPFTMREVVVAPQSPDPGATLTPESAVFTWLPVDRAASYRFERTKPDDPTRTVVETVTTRASAWAPTAALAAGAASWRVTALDAAGRPLGPASAWQPFTTQDAPTEVRRVGVTGSGRVGTELVAGAPGFTPDVEAVTYQWFRIANGTWSRINGATGSAYTVVPGDLGRSLGVEATGSLTGWRSTTSRSDAVTVATGDALVAIQPPRIDGTPVVGRTVTAVPGAWPGSPTLSYQWLRDGVPIDRATRTTLTLGATDQGREITVVETARMSGRSDGTSVSDAVTVVAPDPLVATAPPTVTGGRAVGQTLTATTGTWPVAPRFTYQWFRSGAPVAGATRSTYSVTFADAATPVHVVVTATAPGWSPGTAESAPVPIAPAASTISATASATRLTPQQRATLSMRVSVAGVSSPSGGVTVLDGTRRLATVRLTSSGTATYRLPRLKAGKHVITLVYVGTPQVRASKRAIRLTVTKR